MMSSYSFNTVIFDLDGVITQTAGVHARAWKEAFDEYMRMREKRDGEPFKEFTHDGDYLPYVDGKPRYQGVKSFLESRGIHIPFGDPGDSADTETVCGVGNNKNAIFLKVIKRDGVESFTSSITLLKELRKKGIRVGVASSSKSCQLLLQVLGIEELFETRVDGVVSAELGLKGKPNADIFVKATKNLGSIPAKAIVVEDATSGVQAGRNGEFGLVLGVARKDNHRQLLDNGADVVVSDLSEISIEWMDRWFKRSPRALFENWDKTESLEPRINPTYAQSAQSSLFNKKKLIFFLDYDGTLTPIVSRPELAKISVEMKETVKKLSQKYQVCIVSGRMREDVKALVGIDELIYAGSHGFDISGPSFSVLQPKAKKAVNVIGQISDALTNELADIEGILVEKKKFSVAVHWRLVDEKHLGLIQQKVDAHIKANSGLRLLSGKKVFEIMPDLDWDKGQAIQWIMQELKVSWQDASIIYIGDDVTDEDAFRIVRTRGTGILVSEEIRRSAADFWVSSSDKVRELFEHVIKSTS